MTRYVISDIGQLEETAREVIRDMGHRKILLLEGPMGAGKTTFCAAICKVLGSRDNVSSPTFALVQEYSSPEGPIYHMDLYRLKDTAEAYHAGVEDILYSGHRCLVEWPEKILPLLPDTYSVLTILPGEGQRILELRHYG